MYYCRFLIHRCEYVPPYTPSIISTRGQVVHRSLLNRRHDQHMRKNAPVERERASGSGRREPAGKVDLDIVKIQKLMIEWIGRLVDRLLDYEEKFCPQWVISNRMPLPRCGDQLEHVRRQRRDR